MRNSFHCPECHGPLRQPSRRLDFFCGPCRLAVSVVDEQWATVMRPADMVRQLIPVAECGLRGTEPLGNPVKTDTLAYPA